MRLHIRLVRRTFQSHHHQTVSSVQQFARPFARGPNEHVVRPLWRPNILKLVANQSNEHILHCRPCRTKSSIVQIPAVGSP